MSGPLTEPLAALINQTYALKGVMVRVRFDDGECDGADIVSNEDGDGPGIWLNLADANGLGAFLVSLTTRGTP